MLHLAKGLFEDATSLEVMIKRIITEAHELIPCRKAIVLLLDTEFDNVIQLAIAMT